MTKSARVTALVVLYALLVASCGPGSVDLPPSHSASNERGSIAKVERVGAYPAFVLRLMVWQAHPPAPIPIPKGVRLYKITYWSDLNHKPVLVSGLIGLPKGGPLRGAVVWMHGTTVDRRQSVSAPSLQDGVLLSAVFAGAGYLYVAPDLVGLGTSKETQAYLYNPSTIDSTLDLLQAAQTVVAGLKRSWSPDIYVAGFSQGGQATAVIARELERQANPNLRLRAAAAVAGAYDLAGVSVPWALKGASDAHSAYLSLLALSYSTYYGHPLESIMTPESAARTPRIFDGDHPKDVEKDLPGLPREMFSPDFLSAFDDGRQNWFVDALRQNSINDWAPKEPYRAYYGDNDIDVPPQDSIGFVKRASALGGDIVGVPVGPYDHFQSILQAVPKIRTWFDSLSVGSPSQG